MTARVLIVEDDRVLADLVQEVLQDEGYVARAVPSGTAALEYVAQERQPDVVLLDLRMPEMDGWGFIEACHAGALCQDTPVVLMTGAHGVHLAAEQLRARGVHAVLAKPFDLVGLVAVVARFATPN